MRQNEKNRMRQNEKNRHKNRACKRAFTATSYPFVVVLRKQLYRKATALF